MLEYEITQKGLKVLPVYITVHTVHAKISQDRAAWCAPRLSPGLEKHPEGHQWLKKTHTQGSPTGLRLWAKPTHVGRFGVKWANLQTGVYCLLLNDSFFFLYCKVLLQVCGEALWSRDGSLTLQWSSNSIKQTRLLLVFTFLDSFVLCCYESLLLIIIIIIIIRKHMHSRGLVTVICTNPQGFSSRCCPV